MCINTEVAISLHALHSFTNYFYLLLITVRNTYGTLTLATRPATLTLLITHYSFLPRLPDVVISDVPLNI